MLKYTKDDLTEMQAWPLERKIRVTQTRIMEWYQHYDGNVYVSFSGGKDSTVLLDLARRIYPDIEAVFVDTGLEYPEIKQFVKSKENVTILRPKMVFDEVVRKYGYPIISKKNAQNIYEIKTTKSDYLRGIRLHGNEKGTFGKLPDKWMYLINADFEISHKCCNVMKKSPLKIYQRKNKNRPIIGTMACESKLRETRWKISGCNAFESSDPKSIPMSFWTEQDVLEYLTRFKIPYASVYGDIVKEHDGKYHTTGAKRTGCVFCGFGCHLEKEPNRFQQLKETHPKLYNYCINGGGYDKDGVWKPTKQGLGMGHVLNAIGVEYKEPKKKTDCV